jgi:hypothetical protein
MADLLPERCELRSDGITPLAVGAARLAESFRSGNRRPGWRVIHVTLSTPRANTYSGAFAQLSSRTGPVLHAQALVERVT